MKVHSVDCVTLTGNRFLRPLAETNGATPGKLVGALKE